MFDNDADCDVMGTGVDSVVCAVLCVLYPGVHVIVFSL